MGQIKIGCTILDVRLASKWPVPEIKNRKSKIKNPYTYLNFYFCPMNFKSIDTVNADFFTTASQTEVSTSLLGYFKNTGGKVKTQTPDGFVVDYGSRIKTRLFGTMSGVDIYPRRLTLKLTPENGGTRVSISISDEFGFGSRIMIETQLRQLFDRHILLIRSRFPEA